MNNPQTSYITLAVSSSGSPNDQLIRETFRARGGCCRFYTLPDVDYCTTCVLRKPEERDQRLRDYLLGKLSDA